MFDIVALVVRMRGYGGCMGCVARGPVVEIESTRFLRSSCQLMASKWRACARGLASRPLLPPCRSFQIPPSDTPAVTDPLSPDSPRAGCRPYRLRMATMPPGMSVHAIDALLLGTPTEGGEDLVQSGTSAAAEHNRMDSLDEGAQPEEEAMTSSDSEDDELR